MQFNIADLFECVAEHVPERVAVVCGERRFKYRELDDRATRLADALCNLGVGPGSHVGLYLYNDVEHLEAMLACYKRRAVPVNVNYRYVAEELRYVLDDAEVGVLFFNAELRPQVAAVRDALPGLHHLVEVPALEAEAEAGTGAGAGVDRTGALAYEDVLASGSPGRDDGERSGDDHYILYTGGTTGLPKGVVWRQEDIFFAALGAGNPGGPPITEPEAIARSVVDNPNQRLGPFLAPGDPGPGKLVALSLGPLVHASGQWGALGTLLGGGTLVLNPDRHVDMTRVLALVEREQIGMLTLVGDTSARPLLDALDGAGGKYDTSSLLLLGSGGSILSADVKERLLAALPSVAGILEAIGSSESPAQAVAVATPVTPTAASLTFASKPETMIVDDDLRPVPAGTVGRLATRGRVPLGYWKDPERTARTFVEIDGERWALPGDMAKADADGAIHLLGRGSLCINTGGEKVYPEEVEAVLKAHPRVADAVVVGAPDAQWGEQVVAVVQAEDVTLDELQAHCRERLAGYKVPRALRVVDEVKRSPSGKADYKWAKTVATA
jgi:acyl-CoA synthetase (AMP-forming)/AMP-acid ligase II